MTPREHHGLHVPLRKGNSSERRIDFGCKRSEPNSDTVGCNKRPGVTVERDAEITVSTRQRKRLQLSGRPIVRSNATTVSIYHKKKLLL